MAAGNVFPQRARALFSLLVLLTLAGVWLNLSVGSVHISLGELWDAVRQGPGESPVSFIIWKIRIPRALAAMSGGAFLAVAGLLLQVYFRNPIVGPFVLGISSGATLMVALVMLTSVFLGFTGVGPYVTVLAAFVGAAGAMAVVLAVAGRVRQGVMLLIIGLMIGYLTHAVTSLLIAFAEAERVKGFNLWSLGSFSGYRWKEVAVMMTGGGLLLAGVYALSKPLNAFLLGEEYAQTMGVNVRIFRLLIIFFSCALAALVTATAGPVAFIGLAVPHMARLSLGVSDNRLLIPAAALMGAASCEVCDFAARMMFAPVETPLSAVTSFFGAPVVILLLMKRSSKL